jgi:mono/diheme cytochrome c family protein
MHSNTGRSAKSFRPVAALALVAFSAIVLSACVTATPANTWVKPNQNFKNTRYVGGRINTKTIAIVGVAWTADAETKAGIGNTAPSPFITKRNALVQAPGGRFQAFDLQSGRPAPGVSLAVNASLGPAWFLGNIKRKVGIEVSPILTTGGDDNDDAVVIGADSGTVAAVAAEDADNTWSTELESPSNTKAHVISNMAVAHEKVYVPVANVPTDINSLSGQELLDKLTGDGQNNGQLIALNTSDGKVSWTKKLASVPLGAATVVNNIVFTSTLDGHLYGFNSDNGDQVFESKLPAGAVAPIAASDGTLIVPAGFVYKKGQKAQVVAFTIGGLGTIGGAEAPKLKEQAESKAAAPAEGEKPAGAAPGASTADGKALFTQNCAGCHTLADAGAKGTVGPNLDELKADEALIIKQVTNGGGGMPAFKGTLTPEEIKAIAAYVSSVDGS